MKKVEGEKTTEQLAQERYTLRLDIEAKQEQLKAIDEKIATASKIEAEILRLKGEKEKVDQELIKSISASKTQCKEAEETYSQIIRRIDVADVTFANLSNAALEQEVKLNKLAVATGELEDKKRELKIKLERGASELELAIASLQTTISNLSK